MIKNVLWLFVLCIFMAITAAAQGLSSSGLTAAWQLDAQYYQEDKEIGAEEVSEKILSNSFIDLRYKTGNFGAGIRYESYLNPVLGIDPRYQGSGIAFRFAEYKSDFLDVTAGNFYEQFGSGLIFRAYEERLLGVDNAMDGALVKIKPAEGIMLTGVIGKQRAFWDYGDGIIRGGDFNMSVDKVFEDLLPQSLFMSVGASVISKYQADQESFYYLPENVLAWSARMNLSSSNFNADIEYAYKYNDPNATNNFSYNPGTALKAGAAYFISGFSVSLGAHRLDNMDFRSDRNALGNLLNTNYIPPVSKQHAYRLMTLYPYSTQFNGEWGFQAEATYTFDRKTLIGGKYGTTVNINFSRAQSLDTTHKDEFTYDSPFFNIGDRLYYQDFNIEITKKWNKDFKTKLTFADFTYDKDILEYEGAAKYGKVYSRAAIFEFTYKTASRQALRMEFQHLWSEQDSIIHTPDNMNGNWTMGLAEYTISPGWYFSVFGEYNYGNHDEDKQLMYPGTSVAYIHDATRITIAYGRQRGGLLCVGGVCRPVPASNGVSLSISSVF